MIRCEEVCENEDKGCKDTCCCGGPLDHPWDGHYGVSMHWWYCEGNCERPSETALETKIAF